MKWIPPESNSNVMLVKKYISNRAVNEPNIRIRLFACMSMYMCVCLSGSLGTRAPKDLSHDVDATTMRCHAVLKGDTQN